MLDKAVELMGEGYLNDDEITYELSHQYGRSPLEVLEERERRKEILECLRVILNALTPQQEKVLKEIAIGLAQEQIGRELKLTHQTVNQHRASIPIRLQKIADEDRISELKANIDLINDIKDKKPKTEKKLKLLIEEYEKRYSVREALKKLLVLLTPPESTKEMSGRVNLPSFTFEREMEVGVGMREALLDGRKVMKTKTECHIPEYLECSFGDKNTCCMLCATCKRSKDVVGRKIRRNKNDLKGNLQ